MMTLVPKEVFFPPYHKVPTNYHHVLCVQSIFERVGKVRDAAVQYDQNGNSLGSALVTYSSAQDARKAAEEFDGVSCFEMCLCVMIPCCRHHLREFDPRAVLLQVQAVCSSSY